MKILYQNVVPRGRYGAYGAAEQAIAQRLDPAVEVTFAWLEQPVTNYADGSPEEMARIDREIIQTVRAGYHAFDCVLIGCALDSGVDVLRERYGLRAYGAGEVLYRQAASRGRRFGVVIPEAAMQPQYERLLQAYGACDHLRGFASLTLSNAEMVNDPPLVYERLTQCCRELAASSPLDEIIVGCTLASASLGALGVNEIDGIQLPNLVATPLLWCCQAADHEPADSKAHHG
jgi:Asp/Glu/hydantoin racemase